MCSSDLLLAKEDAGKLATTVDLLESVQAPVEQGQELGQLTILVDGEERASVKLIAQEAVGKLSLLEVYRGLLSLLFCP